MLNGLMEDFGFILIFVRVGLICLKLAEKKATPILIKYHRNLSYILIKRINRLFEGDLSAFYIH